MKHLKNLFAVLIVAMLLSVSLGCVCAEDFDDGPDVTFDETFGINTVGGDCDFIYEPVEATNHAECWVIYEPGDDLDEDSDWDLDDDYDLDDDDFDWELDDEDYDWNLDDDLDDDDFDWELDDEDYDWDLDDDLDDEDDFDWDFDDDLDDDLDWELFDEDYDWDLDDDLDWELFDEDYDWDLDDDDDWGLYDEYDEDFDWDSYDDYDLDEDGIDLDEECNYTDKCPMLVSACLGDANDFKQADSQQAGEYSNLNVLAVAAPSVDEVQTNSTDSDVNATQTVALQENAEDANIFALFLMMLMVALAII